MSNIFQRVRKNRTLKNKYFQIILWIFCGVIVCFVIAYFISLSGLLSVQYDSEAPNIKSDAADALPPAPIVPVLDKVAYDAKLLQLANIPLVVATSSVVTGTSTSATSTKPVVAALWPVKAVYPLGGALLPFNRIVAYYGNF